MIIINTKNYKTRPALLKLAKLIEKYLPKAIIAVPATDISYITSHTRLNVIAQHVDNKESGRTTGYVLAESIKAHGAIGTLLNHSEHHLHGDILKETLSRCHKLKLKTFVCVHDVSAANVVKSLHPTAIAYEDPSLIGTGKPITFYQSNSLREFVSSLKNNKIIPICGAGISSAEDVKAAQALGCKGVLIASAIANTSNPEKLLKALKALDK